MLQRTTSLTIAAAISTCCVALTGCVSSPRSTVPEVWRVDAPVMSPPLAIDGVAIAPVSEADDDYSVRAWDAETGEQLWSTEAVPTANGGVAKVWSVDAAEGTVAMIMVPGEHGMTWRMVEPRSGEEVAWPQGSDDLETSWAAIDDAWDCESEERRALCFSVPDGESSAFLRLGPEVGLSHVPLIHRDDEHISALDGGVYVDIDTGAISLQRGGQRAWTTPFSDMFARERLEGERPKLTGIDENVALLYTNPTWIGAPAEIDLTQTTTTALDPASGAVLWSRDGLLMTQTDLVADVLLAAEVTSGRAVQDADGSYTSHDLDYDVVRIDPATGESVWSIPGREVLLDEGDASFFDSSSDNLVTATDDGAALVDAETGAATPVPAGVALPCRDWDPLERTWTRGSEDVTFSRVGETIWCSTDHEPIDDPVLDRTIVSIVGVEVTEGIEVTLEGSGMVAYDVTG